MTRFASEGISRSSKRRAAASGRRELSGPSIRQATTPDFTPPEPDTEAAREYVAPAPIVSAALSALPSVAARPQHSLFTCSLPPLDNYVLQA
eukprot:888129-Rhodomonas_salina.1